MNTFVHPETRPAERLDKILARHLGLGLRRCRALIDSGLVLVDGRLVPKGGMVRPGQRVSVAEPSPPPERPAGATIVARGDGFAALAKPGGMHTVAGKGTDCLEACLPGLGLDGWRLLNRLDFLTSGLVLAAEGDREAALYKAWQDAGQVRKWYLALARGRVGALLLGGTILDERRRVVRVTAEEDAPLRRTLVRPVRAVGDDTLILALILKGRRHQIRAHLAHAGHPLAGDPVYGTGGEEGLYLHHWRVDMPGFSAVFPPGWEFADMGQAEAVRLAMTTTIREER